MKAKRVSDSDLIGKKDMVVVVDSGYGEAYKRFLQTISIIKARNLIILPFSELTKNSPLYQKHLKNSEQAFVPWGAVYYELIKYNEIPKVDLVLFTGGADVNPELYGEVKHPATFCSKERDDENIKMWELFEDIPKLGICRGSQFLTVMHGGQLIQHVTGHAVGGTHGITYDANLASSIGKSYRPSYDHEGNKIGTDNVFESKITSTHHQMMFPYTLDTDSYKIIAWSTKYKSGRYENGKGENKPIDDISEFVEPEIVWYKNRGDSASTICIQGHPEMAGCPDDTVLICGKIIEDYLIRGNRGKNMEESFSVLQNV